MDKDYEITNIQRRNEWQSSHGGQMQDYAMSLQGVNGWVQLTQKYETPMPLVGATIHGHIEPKTNRNGQTYNKFVKVNPNFAPRGGGVDNEKLDYIVQMLEELTGRRDVVEQKKTETDDPFEGLGI